MTPPRTGSAIVLAALDALGTARPADVGPWYVDTFGAELPVAESTVRVTMARMAEAGRIHSVPNEFGYYTRSAAPAPPPNPTTAPEPGTARDNVLALLARTDHGLGPSDVAETVGISEGYARQLLSDMVEKGQVSKPRHGRYEAVRGVPLDDAVMPPVNRAAELRKRYNSEPSPAPQSPAACFFVVTDEDGRDLWGYTPAGEVVMLGTPVRGTLRPRPREHATP